MKIVRVTFNAEPGEYANGQRYSYFTDQSPSIGDYAVVLSTSGRLKVTTIQEVLEYKDDNATKPVVAIFNMVRHDCLTAQLAAKARAKAELDVMVKQFHETEIYSQLARTNPRAAELLAVLSK